jgi:serine O-acetyltransferase
MWRFNLFLTGADIHPGAEIAGGLRLTHTSGLVIGKGVRIGPGVTLLHGVTLGGASRAFFGDDSPDGFPEIGERAKIAAGAKVLGPVKVGKGSFVGANAVLSRDLADGSVYTPARELSDLRERVERLEKEIALLQSRTRTAQGQQTGSE